MLLIHSRQLLLSHFIKYVLVEAVNEQKNSRPSWPWCRPRSRRGQTFAQWPATPPAVAPQAGVLLGRPGVWVSSRGAAPTVGSIPQPSSLGGVTEASGRIGSCCLLLARSLLKRVSGVRGERSRETRQS